MSLSGKRILVTGCDGMLAADVVPLLSAEGAQLVLSDLNPKHRPGVETHALDITDTDLIKEVVGAFQPDWIFNFAAYTAVDAAESDYHRAFEVNALGPGYLATAARQMGARLLHISSDYVFGGAERSPQRPYQETERLEPCGLYGESKRFGDELVIAALPDQHLIVRTSWLHGLNGPNFIDRIIELATECEELRVVSDQVGSPTWSTWLAAVLVKLASREASGLFHASSRGGISWFDFASYIVEVAGLATRILPQTTEELGRAADRPAYSTLSLEKLEKFLGQPCPDWKTTVAEHIEKRNFSDG